MLLQFQVWWGHGLLPIVAAELWSHQGGLCSQPPHPLQRFRIIPFLLDSFGMTDAQADPHLRVCPELHVPRGSRLPCPHCRLPPPAGTGLPAISLWRARCSSLFSPIQADNWASASAACCSASAFQPTAGASGATLGCATVIPQPPRASLAQYCALGSRMFLSPLHSCEFLYRLKRNLFLIFLRCRGWEERVPRCEGSVAGTAVREERAAAGQDAGTEGQDAGIASSPPASATADHWLHGLSLQPGKEIDSLPTRATRRRHSSRSLLRQRR